MKNHSRYYTWLFLKSTGKSNAAQKRLGEKFLTLFFLSLLTYAWDSLCATCTCTAMFNKMLEWIFTTSACRMIEHNSFEVSLCLVKIKCTMREISVPWFTVVLFTSFSHCLSAHHFLLLYVQPVLQLAGLAGLPKSPLRYEWCFN